MNLMECVKAYEAVQGMQNQEQDYKTAYALTMLKRKLQSQVDFFTQKELELVREYAVMDEKGNIVLTEQQGFTFREAEKAREYAERRGELARVEVEETFEPFAVPAPKTIKPRYLEALEGFISFTEEESA